MSTSSAWASCPSNQITITGINSGVSNTSTISCVEILGGNESSPSTGANPIPAFSNTGHIGTLEVSGALTFTTPNVGNMTGVRNGYLYPSTIGNIDNFIVGPNGSIKFDPASLTTSYTMTVFGSNGVIGAIDNFGIVGGSIAPYSGPIVGFSLSSPNASSLRTQNSFINEASGQIFGFNAAGAIFLTAITLTTFDNRGLIKVINALADPVIDVGSMTISGQVYGSTITTMTNSGEIKAMNSGDTAISSYAVGVKVRAGSSIVNFNNTANGVINGLNAIEVVSLGSITNFINDGQLSGSTGIKVSGSIENLTNNGNISGTLGSGIYVAPTGLIGNLNNAQGGGSPLTYSGVLPTNYKIIIGSPASYGKLSVTSPSGNTNFGIFSGSTVAIGTYSSVLSGLTSNNINNTAGTYGAYNWSLVNSSGAIWDLVIALGGPSAVDTQDALKQSGAILRNVYNMQTALLSNSLNYDCTVFAENGVCVSGGGRFATTNSITGEQTSTLLVAAYKAMSNVRVGAFIDQNIPTTNVTGIAVDKSPMYGVFGVWNENPDAMGYEVRLSTSYANQNITQTRPVVGTSEAGVGAASLLSQAMSGVVSYAMPVTDSTWIASPYAGIRKTKINRGGYTETSAVTAPLTYSDLTQDITTALAGVRTSKKYSDDLYVTASVGIEQNVSSNISDLNATGVTGLTATDFSANYAKTRPVASVGASYAVAKDQRVNLNVMYRKEAFQSAGSTTALLMYQVGL